MEFGVLGPLEVSHQGDPVRLTSPMQRRLLAVLLVHAGRVVATDRLIEVLWRGEPPPSATASLHAYVSRLRRAVGARDGAPVALESRPPGYRLRVEPARIDARRFEDLATAARRDLEGRPGQAAERLADALELWRGQAYAEFADEDFARAEAVRLQELRLAVTEDHLAARVAAGGDPALVGDLEALVAEHPLRERPHAQLMVALSRAGRQAQALEVFRRHRLRLGHELGLDPSPALARLQTDVLRQARHLTPGAAGWWRTRARPPRRDPFPEPPVGGHPPADAEGDASLRGRLPQPATSFVGRAHEAAAVARLLERGPLVTLTGAGGVGKTRLALHVAGEAAAGFPDGTRWCELAPVDPEGVGHAVAAALEIGRRPHRGVEEGLLAALSGRELLLVLDNCEHVVEAVAALVTRVVRCCPRVVVLATSREPLAVAGEQVWTVPPLPVPEAPSGSVGQATAAVELFADRAAAHRDGFSLDGGSAGPVAEICRKLDGLPLAIELAAALVGTMAPAEIAARLDRRFRLLTRGPRTDRRHRSLQAVVDWSYQLLTDAERRLFDRLAVFAGGFTLEAVEEVCSGEDLPAERVAGVLAGLVAKSVVAVDRAVPPTRYRLLETLRQYAYERLAARGEREALTLRHARHFLALAEQAAPHIRAVEEARWVAVLEEEMGNLRAAHRRAVSRGEADLALRLTVALCIFALYRLTDEVFAWAEEAAALPAAADHPLAPAAAGAVALGLSNRGELARARELAERALAALGDPDDPTAAPALSALSVTALYEGRLEDCLRHAAASLALAREAGDLYVAAMAHLHRIAALTYGGRTAAARRELGELRRVTGELGNPLQRAWTLYAEAELLGDEEPDRALRLLDDAVALARGVRGRFLIGVARVASASLRARHGPPEEAVPAFREVITHWRRLGDWTHQWTTLRNLVGLLVRLGREEPAATLIGAIGAAETGAPPFGSDAERLAGAAATLEGRLGREAFAAAVSRGSAMAGEDAVALALATLEGLMATTREP